MLIMWVGMLRTRLFPSIGVRARQLARVLERKLRKNIFAMWSQSVINNLRMRINAVDYYCLVVARGREKKSLRERMLIYS
jgi:hypothetical protein